jgi:hypothetical protein
MACPVSNRSNVRAEVASSNPSPDRMPVALVHNVVYLNLTTLAFTHDTARIVRKKRLLPLALDWMVRLTALQFLDHRPFLRVQMPIGI